MKKDGTRAIKEKDSHSIRILKNNEIVQDKKLTRALISDNYFDNDYMRKIKKEVISYRNEEQKF